MKYSKIGLIAVLAIMVTGCTETKYVAHVAKKIPMPQDTVSKNKGYFKVGSSYKIKGKRYYPAETYNLTETGTASWYGPGFHGKLTANGEIFDKNELTAAHRTLQLPSIVKVTNLDNGRSVILRVNDRGPFAHNRILDVSERGAVALGFKSKGVAKIRLEVLADASKEVAAVSKSGRSTRGMEIAYNEGKTTAIQQVQAQPMPPLKPVPTREIAGNQIETISNTVPVVEAEPLNNVVQRTATSNVPTTTGRQMFVQAGAFSQEANALQYSNKVASLAPSKVYMTRVNDIPYFRVRLGPFNNADQAQQVIASLYQTGNKDAVIVAE